MRQTYRTVAFIQASVSLGSSGQGRNPDVGLLLLLFKKYLFIRLSWVLFLAPEIFRWGTRTVQLWHRGSVAVCGLCCP